MADLVSCRPVATSLIVMFSSLKETVIYYNRYHVFSSLHFSVYISILTWCLEMETILNLLSYHFSDGQRGRGPGGGRVSYVQHSAPYVTCASVEHEVFH